MLESPARSATPGICFICKIASGNYQINIASRRKRRLLTSLHRKLAQKIYLMNMASP